MKQPSTPLTMPIRSSIGFGLFMFLFSSVLSAQIPSTFFGMTFNQTSSLWPQPGPSAIRLWDAGTSWTTINGAPATYDWSTLDRWLDLAQQNGADVVYTFGRTPQWASSNPTDTSCSYGPGQCWPPVDLSNWDNFVSAIVTHSAARIKFWELWNEPDAPNHWSGDTATLVTMSQHAYQIIKSIDPSATVISPCPQGINGYKWLKLFFAAGGGQYIDVVAFHGYVGSPGGVTNPAEIINDVVANVISAMSAYGQNAKPLWDTEANWGSNAALADPSAQAAFLTKLYVLQQSKGVQRFYWYHMTTEVLALYGIRPRVCIPQGVRGGK
jgi:hypothetical protein